MASKKPQPPKGVAQKIVKVVKRTATALAGKEDWITIRPKKKKPTKKGPS